MRKFLNVKTEMEYFAPLRSHFLQYNSGEHVGNINLGTSCECFLRAFLTVKTDSKEHRNKTDLFIRPPNSLTNLYLI